MAKFTKGHTKIGGRKKGEPNKTTTAVKDMVLAALDAAGGIKYLQRQADENPSAFLSLIGKVMPTQVTGEDGGPVKLSLTVAFLGPSRPG